MRKKRRVKATQFLPIVIILVPTCILYRNLETEVVIPRIEFILNALITCAATFSGFTLTIVSILAGFINSPVMTYIIKNHGMPELSRQYTCSLLLGFILIIACIIVGSILDQSNKLSNYVVAGGVAITLAYFYSLLSSGWYMLWIISKVASVSIKQGESSPQIPAGKNRL